MISAHHGIMAARVRFSDPDAATWGNAVEAADGALLEPGIVSAVEAFVQGLKQDGIWPKIEASCILAGARSLGGALVPLRGPAPTNINFTTGDYSRRSGLVGDGITTRIDTNFGNVQPGGQDDKLAVIWVSQPFTGTTAFRGLFGSTNQTGGTMMRRASNLTDLQARVSSSVIALGKDTALATGMIGLNRSTGGGFTLRLGGSDRFLAVASTEQLPGNISVHSVGTANFGNARIAFYAFGRALADGGSPSGLARLDSRLSTLMSAISEAIP
jgi:hypothetical protein